MPCSKVNMGYKNCSVNFEPTRKKAFPVGLQNSLFQAVKTAVKDLGFERFDPVAQ